MGELFEVAAGRLYWSLERTLETDVNYLLIAREGQMAMLRAIFGSSETSPKSQSGTPQKRADGTYPILPPSRGARGELALTSKAFDAVFARSGPRVIRRK